MRPRKTHRIDRGMIAWIKKTARQQRWRCPDWMDFDDIVQEGYTCYAKCNERYARECTQAHIMALTKTAFRNKLHDLSKQKRRQLDAPLALHPQSLQSVEEALEALLPVEPEAQTFGVLLSKLPQEIREMLTLLMSDARPMLTIGGSREGTNRYLWRLIGQQPCGIDLYSAFCNHFGVKP